MELATLVRLTSGLRWSPALLSTLLAELHVGDHFDQLFGPAEKLSRRRYAQAVAVAIAFRHSWRPDDLAATRRRLGLRATKPSSPGDAGASRRKPPDLRRNANGKAIGAVAKRQASRRNPPR